MPDVLIVARTKMGDGNVCIGGYDITNKRNVRLLDETGANQSASCPFQIGEVWVIDYIPRKNIIPPHTEDVLVLDFCQINKLNEAQLYNFISGHCVINDGSIMSLFEGCVQLPNMGSAFISKRSVPNSSVCFWKPDSKLKLLNDSDNPFKYRFKYRINRHVIHLPYVGERTDLVPGIVTSVDSIVRLSIARWWTGTSQQEEHCYLQLSGWY